MSAACASISADHVSLLRPAKRRKSGFSTSVGKSPKIGTLRWREPESNFWFLGEPEIKLRLARLGAIRPQGQSSGMPEMRPHSANSSS
jgi:hypothetical protein